MDRGRPLVDHSEFHNQIVVLLAEHSMNVSEVARILNYHRNSIMYHIGLIREMTGKNPMNLFDLADLIKVGQLRTGRWKPTKADGKLEWECSVCKTVGHPEWIRCPVCEAKMIGRFGE